MLLYILLSNNQLDTIESDSEHTSFFPLFLLILQGSSRHFEVHLIIPSWICLWPTNVNISSPHLLRPCEVNGSLHPNFLPYLFINRPCSAAAGTRGGEKTTIVSSPQFQVCNWSGICQSSRTRLWSFSQRGPRGKRVGTMAIGDDQSKRCLENPSEL